MTSTNTPQVGDLVTGLDCYGVIRSGRVCGPVTVAGDPVAIPGVGVTYLIDAHLAETEVPK